VLTLFTLALGLSACGPKNVATVPVVPAPAAVPAAPAETIPPPIEKPQTKTEPTPASQKSVHLKLPEAAAKKWRAWNGRYVVFAHRSAGVKTLDDLNGRDFHCAMIETDAILGDMMDFGQVAGIQVNVAIQNNPEVYDTQFLKEADAIGVMVPAIAKHYKFRNNAKLVEIVLQ
jgi:hypothetical protein